LLQRRRALQATFGGKFMIVVGLLSAVCLGAGSIVYFVWRDRRV
jgi:hypothetical protein